MKIGLVSHFFSESLLIKSWLDWHIPLFDRGVLINQGSTDNSVDIAAGLIPPSWQIVDSKLDWFDACETDREVEFYESMLKKLGCDWIITLNTTEFMFTPNLKDKLAAWSNEFPEVQAFGARSFVLIDKDLNQPLESPIWKNRNWGYLEYEENKPLTRHRRLMHNQTHGQYTPGRHSSNLPSMDIRDFTILHFNMSPYPQCIPRKLQIDSRIPDSNRAMGFGVQHFLLTSNILEERRQQALTFSDDLFKIDLYKKYYEELISCQT